MQLLENPACDRRCLSRIPAPVFEPSPTCFERLKVTKKALLSPLPEGQKNHLRAQAF
jgi:hypothetical protein